MIEVKCKKPYVIKIQDEPLTFLPHNHLHMYAFTHEPEAAELMTADWPRRRHVITMYLLSNKNSMGSVTATSGYAEIELTMYINALI